MTEYKPEQLSQSPNSFIIALKGHHLKLSETAFKYSQELSPQKKNSVFPEGSLEKEGLNKFEDFFKKEQEGVLGIATPFLEALLGDSSDEMLNFRESLGRVLIDEVVNEVTPIVIKGRDFFTEPSDSTLAEFVDQITQPAWEGSETTGLEVLEQNFQTLAQLKPMLTLPHNENILREFQRHFAKIKQMSDIKAISSEELRGREDLRPLVELMNLINQGFEGF